ncbi:protein rhomboid-like [Tigriopus californicus]|uniref:protein rhomboid-like n=1 Tax=Tigriopus californicus TaxID=6832 RepID=UPI0027DA15FE|nr:protein rhomboid-like [Tigriopus californicus]
MELRSLPSGPPSRGEHIFWQEVFSKLSYASHSPENQNLNPNSIDLKKLEGYLRGASSFSLEQKTGLPRRKLLFILRNIKKADLNQDGLICEMEWETFVQNGKGAFFGGGGMANVARVFMYAPTFSCKPPTMFLLIISLIQIACFTLSVAIPETIGSSLEYGDRNWPVDSFLIYNPYRRYEAWRFVSYMFLHADYGHIGFNLLVQFLVGIPLEMSQLGWTGSLRVAFLYFCGVAFGSLGSSVTSPDTYLLGASAGVYALIAAHMATLILNWHEDGIIYAKRLRKSRNTDEPTPNDLNPVIRGLRLVFLIVFVVVDVGQIVYKVYFLGRPGNTSYTGHAYGALTGLITGIFILENRKVEDWERWIEWSALILFALGLCALILVHIVNPGFFPEQDYSGLA